MRWEEYVPKAFFRPSEDLILNAVCPIEAEEARIKHSGTANKKNAYHRECELISTLFTTGSLYQNRNLTQ